MTEQDYADWKKAVASEKQEECVRHLQKLKTMLPHIIHDSSDLIEALEYAIDALREE